MMHIRSNHGEWTPKWFHSDGETCTGTWDKGGLESGKKNGLESGKKKRIINTMMHVQSNHG